MMNSGGRKGANKTKEWLSYQNKSWVVFRVSELRMLITLQIIRDGDMRQIVMGRANVSLSLVKFLILMGYDLIEREPKYEAFYDVQSVTTEHDLANCGSARGPIKKLVSTFQIKRNSSESPIYRKFSKEETK